MRDDVEQAAEVLRRGGVVCFPTETYYGLAVDAFDEEALERLRALKGRDLKKPFALIVSDRKMARRLWSRLPASLAALCEQHWPGPLTIVAPAAPDVPRSLLGHGGGVGARASSHPVARKLVQAFGGPITATSANRQGESPSQDVAAARAAFPTGVDHFVDGGTTSGGAPSTLVGMSPAGELVVLRTGSIPIQKS